MLSACGKSNGNSKPGTDDKPKTEDGAGTDDGSDKNVIKIGVFEPLTGENGGGGYQEVLGIRYANKMYPTVEIDGVTYDIVLEEVDN